MSDQKTARSDYIFVSSYTRFDNLAHKPRGTEAKFGIYTYQLNVTTGELTLMSVTQDGVSNPSFTRYHPNKPHYLATTR